MSNYGKVEVDLDNDEQLEAIVKAFKKYEGGREADALQLAFLSLRPTPQPEGWQAVVRDADGWEWVSPMPSTWFKRGSDYTHGFTYWVNIPQPVEVLFPGVT